MFKRFSWTPASLNRNTTTLQYEPIQPYIFVAGLRRLQADVVFDVGANIGQYSMFAASLPSVQNIYAFEAEQTAYTHLTENIKLNSVGTKITPRLSAVSDSDGDIVFGVAGPMAGNNAVVDTSIHNVGLFKERRTVPAIALDSEYSRSDKRLGFKVDVEGHEAAVIDGAKRLLSQNLCFIQVEIYRGQESILSTLEQMGYRTIFHAGPDHYCTNFPDLADRQQTVDLIEEAIGNLIEYNLKG